MSNHFVTDYLAKMFSNKIALSSWLPSYIS